MYGTTSQNNQSQLFTGIRFVLLGFDPVKKSQVSRKLVNLGGVDVGLYGPNCTHVIVDNLVYDDPVCVAAREDGKKLVSSLWVEHSFAVGAPVDTTSLIYRPVRDLNGIPGAETMLICLTGYQREDREDIMTMVELMGARFSKPLIANKVTHLICYKFEGEKYLLAKRVKTVKLINHLWLEDCLKAWEIVPEANYSKSGYELEMEAEAGDSEDEPEGIKTRHTEGKLASPPRSLLLKPEIPKTSLNTAGSNLFSDVRETVSVTMKTTSDQIPNSHESKIKQHDAEHITSLTSGPSNQYGKTVSSSPAKESIIHSFKSANKSPQVEAKPVISASYPMKDPDRTTPAKSDKKNNTGSFKRLRKLNVSEAFNMSPSLIPQVTPTSRPAFCPENEQNDASCGSFKLQQTSHSNDVGSAFQELKKDPSIEASPASNISGRIPSSYKARNVTCDVAISKTLTSESEDPMAVQRPEKECNETSLFSKSNNGDVGMTENVLQSPSAVSSDLQKSGTLNSEINEQSGGSNSKPVRRKSISKKFLAPKLSKNHSVNQKGSIFLKNTKPGIDDENLFKYQQCENVSSVVKAGTKIETSPQKTENMSENKSLFMDDETEPPDDKDEASKEKSEDGEPQNTVGTPMEEKAEGNVDVLDPSADKSNDEDDLFSLNQKVPVHKSDGYAEVSASATHHSKKGKKNIALSMEEVSNLNSVNINDHNHGKQDSREEATPDRGKRARRTVDDLEKLMEVKKTGDYNDPEHNNGEEDDDVEAEMDIQNVVNEKETKRSERTPDKTKKDMSKITDTETSVDVEIAGVCNDPKHNNEENDDARSGKDADSDAEDVRNKKETKRNKRPLSRTKKIDGKAANKKIQPTCNQEVKMSDLEEVPKENAQVDVDYQSICNETGHKNKEKDNVRAEEDADMDTENVLKKKETKGNKRPLSISKKDDNKNANKNGQPTFDQAFKTFDFEEAQKENAQMHIDDQSVLNDHHKNIEKDNDQADEDVDMDTENVLNKKETNRNKRPLSRAKKDDVKTVIKKEKPTSNRAIKRSDFEEAQKDNAQIHIAKDNDRGDKVDDMDLENVLSKKETGKNKRSLSRTKKDDAKTVNKKGKPTSNQAVKTSDFREAQNEISKIGADVQGTGNKRVSKSAKDLPEKNTDKADSDVVKDEPRWFILTGHNLQRREFQQIIKRLKGRVCRVTHNWSYQATHFIVPDPIKRTEKFFAAAASGRWILKTDYLSASNQAGKFLPEETYEWHKNGLSEDGNINLEAPRKWRLFKEKTGHGAFYGMSIVIYGECISPSLDTLKRAVRAGDGTILATSPPYTRYLKTGIDFAVVSTGMLPVDMWVQEFLKHEIPCVSADYLVEYVCKPGYPLEKHIQFGTHVWAERSFKSLNDRLEEENSEPTTPDSDDVACDVCGARDRGEEMLICGDEGGLTGCGVGTHIDCCDPPLESVPEDDWFCSKCCKKPNNTKNKNGNKKKDSASRGK